MNSHKDIFDKIMCLRIFQPLQSFFYRFREPLLYLFFGGISFLLNIVLYWIFAHLLYINPLIANIISWILCVAFAYITNRAWVFSNKAIGVKGIVRETMSFVAGRLATLGMEELILYLGIMVLGINDIAVKISAQILVVICNYVISKWFVFKK